MFWHNYLSVNGIASFPSFTWLCKYKEEYKKGEMWHSAQKAEIDYNTAMYWTEHGGRVQHTSMNTACIWGMIQNPHSGSFWRLSKAKE
jgi:hypothetical protein